MSKCSKCGRQIKPRRDGFSCGKCGYFHCDGSYVVEAKQTQPEPDPDPGPKSGPVPIQENEPSPPEISSDKPTYISLTYQEIEEIAKHIANQYMGDIQKWILDSLFGFGIELSNAMGPDVCSDTFTSPPPPPTYAQPPYSPIRTPPTREEQMRNLSKAIQHQANNLNELREERDYMLSMTYTLFHQRQTEKFYNDRIKHCEDDLIKLETKYAHLRDSLPATPEEGAARDGISMRLLDW